MQVHSFGGIGTVLRNSFAALLVIIPTVSLTTAPVWAFEITNASKVSLVVVGERFTSPAKYLGHYRCGMELYRRTFFVRRKGGECWRCPIGFAHATGRLATGPRACKRVAGSGGKWTKATYVKKARKECPDITGGRIFRSLNSCYSCPVGFYHNKLHFPNLKNALDLTKRKKACLPKSYFYKLVKPGTTVRGGYQRLVYNLSGSADARLRFSVFYTARKCGWYATPRAPKGTPPLMPNQKACEVVSFFMKANEEARATFDGKTGSVTVHRNRGAAYKMFCKPQQPPNHGGGLSCSASAGPVRKYQY